MDWQTLKSRTPRDIDYPPRAAEILALEQVLDGTLYDAIPYSFGDERNAAGEYVPLRERRPSVRTHFCRTAVDDAVTLLFDEDHFPEWTADDTATVEALRQIARAVRLNQRMIEAATYGAAGSVALLLRIVEGRPRVEVMRTAYLSPTFDPADGETVTGCVEAYKVPAATLRAMGLPLPDEATGDWWWRREWTATQEVVFAPQSLGDRRAGIPPVALPLNPAGIGTVTHDLGFVPIVWIRNLPGGSGVDGAPTVCVPAVTTMIEADYQLSQAGRGLKYASDPTLMIRDPGNGPDAPRVGGASSALIVGEGGDAKLLEINGTAAAAVVEYVRTLRETALEAMHGNRTNADKLTGAQSGRALEIMHQPLISVAARLRISYGEVGLVALLAMICRASERMPIVVSGAKYTRLNASGLSLKWPPWFAPTYEDRAAQAQALSMLRAAGMVSRETAVRDVAPVLDVEDVPAELARIAADETAQTEVLAARAAQTKATEIVTP